MALVIQLLLSLIIVTLIECESFEIPHVRSCCNSNNNENTNVNCVRVNENTRSELTCIPYICTHKSSLQLLNNTEEDGETRIISLQSCLLRPGFLNITNNSTMLLNSTINELEIFNNGKLTYVNRTGYKYAWTPDLYCIDTNTDESLSLLLQDTNKKTIIYICMDATAIHHIDDDDPAIIWLYLIITSIAAFILLFTMICFILSYKKQNIHGWTQFTHVLAFFLLMVFWNLDDTSGLVENRGTFSCKFFAIGSHFFYISLFSWLLTVNYDLLRAFRMPGQMEFRSQVNQFSRYLLYSSFGWGVPCIVVTLGILCSLAFDSPKDEHHESLFDPMYGIKNCSISFRAYWIFLIFPTAILLSLVFIIFIKMVTILERQRRSSARRKATTVIGMKILFLMGPFWFLDLITMIHIAIYRDEFIWYILIFDIVVIYQAVPLFVIYICRPDTLLYLQDHYPRFKKVFITIGKVFCVQYPEEQSSSFIELDTKLRINRRPSIIVPSPHRPKRVSVVDPAV